MSVFENTMLVAQRHWRDIAERLGEAGRARLAALLRAASGPGDHGMDQLRVLDFLVRSLPPDHPVRQAVADPDARLGGPATGTRDDVDAILARLAADLGRPPPEDATAIAAAIRDRLRRAPSYDAETVARFGEDPGSGALIRLDGRYPAFQFDGAGGVWRAVTVVNRLLRADLDPWGTADWWLSVHAWLGRRPVELLGADRDDELVAAAAAVGED